MTPRAIPHSHGEVICLPSADRLWLPIRKNAHTAIFEAIWANHVPWYPVQPPERHSHALRYPRVALWRDPFARIESAYCYFTVRHQLADLPPNNYDFAPWVQAICAQADEVRNPHMATQHRIATLFYPDLPQRIVRWDFNALAQELGLSTIPKANPSASRPIQWTDRVMDQFVVAYAIDFEIWNRR